jgi:PAS domain S-box-containing protein
MTVFSFLPKMPEVVEGVLDSTLLSLAVIAPIWFLIVRPIKHLAEQKRLELESYKDALQNLVIISKADANGKIIYANQKFQEISGYTEKELLGTDHRILNSQLHPSGFFAAMWDQIKLGNHWRGLIRNKAKDGHYYWVDTTINPIFDSDGNIDQFLSIRHDITKEMRDLEVSEQQKLFYETILNTMTDGFVIQDKEGKIQHYNLAALRILGRTKDEIMGKSLVEPGFSCIREDLSSFPAFEHPTMFTLRTGIPQKNIIMGLKNQEGITRWLKINSVAFRAQSALSQGEVLTTFCDITEQIQIETENKFIVGALKIGLWKWDIQKNKLVWDDSMYELFEISKADFAGDYEAWENALLEEEKETAVLEVQKALRGEKEFDTTFKIKTKQGDVRSIGARGIVVRNENGEPLQMYGVNWDRTKEVLLEQNLELERSKVMHAAKLASIGEMAGGIAHEINTPLGTIKLTAVVLKKMIQEDFPDLEVMQSHLVDLEKTVDRMAAIIRNLKSFARDDHSDPFQTEDLRPIIMDTASICQGKFDSHGVKLILELPEFPVNVSCRAGQVSQVLLNLFNNAFDAIELLQDKWIKVQVDCIADVVKILVIDSGQGIESTTAKKIFDPFFTTKGAGKGTGLGLSLSYGIIKSHGGRIYIKSDHTNTCFVIKLPKIIAENKGVSA